MNSQDIVIRDVAVQELAGAGRDCPGDENCGDDCTCGNDIK